jgi:hypothetical protein
LEHRRKIEVKIPVLLSISRSQACRFDHAPVILAGLGDAAGEGKKKAKKKAGAAAKSRAGRRRAA